jgi:hypothetical protein
MMELGVLSDMFDIDKKALKKLFTQQVKICISNLFFVFYSFSLFLILILSLIMFRVPIESSFYLRTRKW